MLGAVDSFLKYFAAPHAGEEAKSRGQMHLLLQQKYHTHFFSFWRAKHTGRGLRAVPDWTIALALIYAFDNILSALFLFLFF